ncbi:MAG: ROK family protein [Alphaproteobacteria bacterium]|nr:ROK family protein [Alphaproteobacteria bacterium]MBM3654764.1 ROK family protein [Alphaproteobacteria bacterium]
MYVAVDIGGTKTRVSASSDLTQLKERVIIDTPQNYRAAIDVIISVAVATGAAPITNIVIE